MNAEYTEHVYQEYHYKGYEPIHQREEIVRCRDCVWFCAGNEQYAAVGWCRNFGCEVEPDGFCKWGERK